MRNDKHSHINADEEQSRLLDLQRTFYEGSDKPLALTFCAIFFSFIFIFAILFWALPDKASSEKENRTLTSAPKLTASSLIDGKYTSEFASYMADQFPFRNFFIGVKAECEKIMLKGQNNGVIIADDEYLVTRYDNVDKDILENNLDCISTFMKKADEKNVRVTFAAAGRTMDTASSKLPAVYGSDSSDRAWTLFNDICKEKNIPVTNLLAPLKEHFENGEYVYYKTDHHWTTLGAFYALSEIEKASGLKESTIDDFTRVTVSTDFLGTTWSSAGINEKSFDTVELFRFDGDEDIVRRIGENEEALPLYDMDALGKKDKYSVFIGGNNAYVTLTKEGEERERILVVKDSFAHSLAPMLAKDYDVTLVDLRYYSSSLWDLIEKENIRKVILIYNMDTLSGESGFRMFKAGS